MKSRLCKGFIFVLLCSLMGCEMEITVRDVSSDETKNGGFVIGGRYVLLQDVFARGWVYGKNIDHFRGSDTDKLINLGLTTPRGREVGSVPSSIEDWKLRPQKYPLIYGLVEKGSSFIVIRVNEYRSIDTHVVQVLVRLEDGEFSNLILDIREISKTSFRDLKVSPDFSVIRMVDPEG